MRSGRSPVYRLIAAVLGAWLVVWLAAPGLLTPCAMNGMPGMQMEGDVAAHMGDQPAPTSPHRSHAPASPQCTCPCCAAPVAVPTVVLPLRSSIRVVRTTAPDRDGSPLRERRSHADHFATGPPGPLSLATA